MGADNAQTLKAIHPAAGGYPRSITHHRLRTMYRHGLKQQGRMGRSQHEEEFGCWCSSGHLWRYNPLLAEEGEPFTSF